MSRPASRNFLDGGKTVELKGKCKIGEGLPANAKAIVYNLVADNPFISLSFYRLDQNILHLLSSDKNLMVGSAAWSYTLNRKDPVYASSGKIIPKPVSQTKINSNSAMIGIFQGRSPCSNALKELHNITSNNCGIIKCQLKLYQDSITHTPTTFLLNTIYVGFG